MSVTIDNISSLQAIVDDGHRSTARRPRKRPDQVADQIKRWIVLERIEAGEKLPQEKELIEIFGVSKGTVREALKSLEVQGLVRIRTGPGGGATVVEVTFEKATELLGNYFYSRDLSLRHLYELRKLLSPELAYRVCGHLEESDFRALERSIAVRVAAPKSPQEGKIQGYAAIDFHDVLADASPNPVLGFQCRWVNTMLKTLTVAQQIYERPREEMAARGRDYHVALVEAFRAEEADRARAVMTDHIEEAERYMLGLEAVLERRFVSADEV